MRNELDPSTGATGPAQGAAAATATLPAPGDLATAAERLLAQVSDLLNSSLDYRATIQSVARLAAGLLGEYCIVHVEDAGQIRALGIAHADITRESELRDILRLLPIGPTSHNPVVEVLRTGRPRLMATVGAEQLDALTGSSPGRAPLLELGLSSVLIVPLTARGHTLGAISLARSGDAPPYARSDQAVVEELARRAALAVDNARLYREARREARARERTLGVVSHDLRNALNAATVHSDLLLEMPPEQLVGAHGRKQIVGLRRTLAHMQRLVEDLLDAENIESGRLSLELAPLDLRLLQADVEELFAPLALERGVELTVELPRHVATVRADHVRIVQVLSNLLTNALDFTSAGGRIRVRGEAGGGRLHVTVADTGSGIPADELPYVFDRHWRGSGSPRSGTGSGLGLTIVRGIVGAHGGETWAESVEGEGSTFHFTLPCACAEQASAV